jgi:hypothetical protein
VVPSVATIWRVLSRRGFVVPQPRKRPRSSWRRFAAELPNECWQADTTHWALAGGREAEILNIIDEVDVHGKVSASAARSSGTSLWSRHDETGQLSNPARRLIQRRLRGTDVDQLVTGYRAGRSLPDLADAFGVHRRTVAAHLERRGVQRRESLRKVTE